MGAPLGQEGSMPGSADVQPGGAPMEGLPEGDGSKEYATKTAFYCFCGP